jgi:hypothetical protein
MSFPSGTVIENSNLDSGTDSPANARADLLSLVNAFNQVIASENGNNGVCVLDNSGKLQVAQLPTTINTSVLSLQPNNGVVQIVDCIRLPRKTVADLATDFPSPQAGDIVNLSNGDGGDPCLAVYDGTNWKVIALGATASAT